MNGHVTALRRVHAAEAVAVVLLGASAAGPTLAQGAPLRAPAAAAAARSVAHASIVGGSDASITEFPFQVALYDPGAGSPAKGFFCGGVILGPTRVATAAHCLLGEHGQHSPLAEIEVLAGSTYLEPIDPGSIEDPVVAATVDSAYNPSTGDYDVGLLRLARPLWSGPAPVPDGRDAIAPLVPDASLARQRSAATLGGQVPTSPGSLMVSGWGDLNSQPGGAASYPRRLREVYVPLVPTALCVSDYATIEQAITARMMCAGGVQENGQVSADSCYGDSGGPLVAAGPAGAGSPAGDVLLGLVDFGNGCAQVGYPGVYVRVADAAVARFLNAGPPLASAGRHRRALRNWRSDRARSGSPGAGGQRVRRGRDRWRHHGRGRRARRLHTWLQRGAARAL